MSKPTSPVLQSSNGLSSGLLRCLAFTEGSGSTLTDYSTNAANLTTRSNYATAAATWGTDSTYGPYITFDGSTQDAVGSDVGLLTGTAARTFAFLFRCSTPSPGRAYFFAGYGTGGDSAFGMGLAAPAPGITTQGLWVTTLAHGAGTSPSLVDSTWHLGHIVIDASDNLTMFIDGQATNITTNGSNSSPSAAFSPLSTALSGKFFLGQIGGNTGNNPDGSFGNTSNGLVYKGDLAGVWAWNRVLSPAEVTNHVGDPWQMVRAPAPVATVSRVTIAPSTINLVGGGMEQFAATVQGTNNPGQGVTWTATAGTIDGSGAFTSPPATNASQTITITATSTVDLNQSGTATAIIAAANPSTPPTTITLSGGSGGLQGVASAPLTATLNHPAGAGGLSVKLVSSVVSDNFSATTLTIPSGISTATFTITPGSTGSRTITASASGLSSGMLSYMATATPASGNYLRTFDVGTAGLALRVGLLNIDGTNYAAPTPTGILALPNGFYRVNLTLPMVPLIVTLDAGAGTALLTTDEWQPSTSSGSAASASDVVTMLLAAVGPLRDAVSIWTGFYGESPDGLFIINFDRQGVEIDRYPIEGRTSVDVSFAGSLAP